MGKVAGGKAAAGKGPGAKAKLAMVKEPEAPKPEKPVKQEVPRADLETLRGAVKAAKDDLDKAQIEAKELTERARSLVGVAKETYHQALAPYREACRRAGVECEFEGGRSTNISEKVTFLVEKTGDNVRIMIKDRPETKELIPLAVIRESVGKAAYSYTEKHLGPREEIGNKGGSLSNRLRVVLKA